MCLFQFRKHRIVQKVFPITEKRPKFTPAWHACAIVLVLYSHALHKALASTPWTPLGRPETQTTVHCIPSYLTTVQLTLQLLFWLKDHKSLTAILQNLVECLLRRVEDVIAGKEVPKLYQCLRFSNKLKPAHIAVMVRYSHTFGRIMYVRSY